MKLLVTGRNGQVGFELQRSLAPLGQVVALDREQCDIADPDALRNVIRRVAPDIVVNAAAYTAVDKAESDEQRAHAANSVAPRLIGELARETGALVVHFSTDYVFDGAKQGAYNESDAPNPLSVYGRTKLLGERALAETGARCLIFRTSWVYGAHGGNFVKTMLKLAAERTSLSVVADQFGAPTSAALIADVTAQILGQYIVERRGDLPFGLYHLSASGRTCWHEYARTIIAAAEAAGRQLQLGPAQVRPISTSEYPTPAVRPPNSILDTAKLRETFGLHLPCWQSGLDHVLKQIL